MSIGEYAGLVELSVSAVRFYADRGLLVPATIDSTSGYRYYTEDQVPRGSMIRDLRLMDMSLTEIRQVLELAPEQRASLIQEHIDKLESHLKNARGVARTLESDRSKDTTLVGTDLARAIVQVVAAAGVDPVRPDLMGVLVEVKDNSLRCAATDTYRLNVRDLVPATVGSTFSAVVAAAALRTWPQLLDSSTEVTLVMDGDNLIADGNGVRLRCPTMPLAFPDYETFLETSTGLATTIVVDRQELMSALQTFVGDGTVSLATVDSDVVVGRDGMARSLAAEVSGAAATVAVNPRFVCDAAAHAVGAELIIEIDDALSPLTFRSADDGTYTSLLMPVKVD